MWYLIGGILVMYVILRVLIRHAEKQFDKVNAEEISERNEMSKKYLREERDDLVGLANAIVIVNQQGTYVKMYLKKRRIYWLARILTFPYVGKSFLKL
ncbi:MAG: hypothetical protein WAZ12_00490 [Candidatus Absconditicoccaceae bacterium]